MRTITVTISILLGLNLPLHAAVFSCQFLGGAQPLTCTVDSTKLAKCQQSYSASLIAWCQGGTDVPSTINHLGCFFAVPAAQAAVEKELQSSEPFAKGAATVPGVRAEAMEWLPSATAAGNNLGLMYSDGSMTDIVLCNLAN